MNPCGRCDAIYAADSWRNEENEENAAMAGT